MKQLWDLLLILLNHLISSSEFNHWVSFDFDLILSMWICKFTLAFLPRKDFDGLVVLQLMLWGKLGFWSLTVMNASALRNLGILIFFV